MHISLKINRKGMAALSVALLGVVLALTLAGCGSNNSNSASASASSASASATASVSATASASAASVSSSASASDASTSASAAASAGAVKYASLEDFLSTEQGMQELQSAVNTTAFEQLGTIDVAVSGNDLIYTVTLKEALDKDPIDDEAFSGEAEKAVAQGIAAIEKEVGVDDVTIQFVFKDSTGKEWHIIIFDNQGMVK